MRKRTSSVTIDGRSFQGRDVIINGDKVTVDGVEQEGNLIGDVNIEVHGDVEHLENDCGKVVARNVKRINTMSGDIECGDVEGSVETMSGDIRCGTVGGSVSTMSGDVRKA